MIREILCSKCGQLKPQHPEDVAMGFKRRRTTLTAVKPDQHGITFNGEFMPLRSIMCDHCNTPIADGQEAIAVTTWRSDREGEPGFWEADYQVAKK